MNADESSIFAIASRADFLAAVRAAFAQAEERDAAEILIVDPSFDDWPLNEPALVDSLARWVSSRKSLTVFAHRFDELARLQLRFVAWRRQWSHVVHCRSDPELEAEQIPSLMLVPGVTSVRLLDRVRHRGIASGRAVDLAEGRETIDALLQRSVEAFPVTTLGL
jgi:hypothetical protein